MENTQNKENKNEPGKRFDHGKLRFDLLPAEWGFALAEIMTRGAEKYDARNWEKGMSWSRAYAPIQRHLHKYWSGQDFDEESGLPHLAHAAWGCLALLTFMRTHPELDDRVKVNVKIPDPTAPTVGA